ncbi:MAG: bifunctional DNA primase/polymerase [Proteobacteria bacterium]|nr:bifunctional DNA primase/polymerase [Pseudomonadota bacterium]
MNPAASIVLDAAHGYTESSPQWPIFPADAKTKRPLIKTGIDHAEHASTDAAVLRRWITTDFPGCAIGMPTGKASLTVVIDADAKLDGEALLAELEHVFGPLPRERQVRTQSGGLHVYMLHPGTMRVRTGAGMDSPLGRLLGRPGVDVRADGGIVILPPSCGYRWIADDDRLPPVPLLWLAAIQGVGDPPPAPRPVYACRSSSSGRWTAPERGDLVPEGDRNGRLHRRGVLLRCKGATDAEILDDLERLNAARCVPPLHAREIAKIAASAARRTS